MSNLLLVTYTFETNNLTCVETDIPLVVIIQYIVKILLLIIFYDNDSELLFNKVCQMVKNKLAFMITKTLFIRCFSGKCGLSWDI